MRKHALLVGVEDYRDKMISRLNFARADATALAERLSDRCGFDHVRVLAGEGGEDEPLLVNIITALRDTSAELQQDDLFLFFFAGHGVEKDGHGYLLARDSLQAFPEHGSLSLELLRKTFEHLISSKRILLLDACRNSPDAGRSDAANCMGDVISRDIVAAARSKLAGGTTTALLSACRSGQRAYEWPAKRHGVFTQYLLNGFDGEAWADGQLTFRDLSLYVTDQVQRWSRNTPGLSMPQEPWYEEFGTPLHVVLATNVRSHSRQTVDESSSPSPSTIQVLPESMLRIKTTPAGAAISINGRRLGNSPTEASLPSGKYTLRAELDGYAVWERDVLFEKATGSATVDIRLEESQDAVIGRVYDGRVISVRDFGVFIELPTGQDGLCHISELDIDYVKQVTDICDVGDTLKVEVVAIDDQGRIKLSRKKVLTAEGNKSRSRSPRPSGKATSGDVVPRDRLSVAPQRNSTDGAELTVTCPNCGRHTYSVPKTPGSYKFKCPNTKYVLGIGKYVLITVKRNGKVVAR